MVNITPIKASALKKSTKKYVRDNNAIVPVPKKKTVKSHKTVEMLVMHKQMFTV